MTTTATTRDDDRRDLAAAAASTMSRVRAIVCANSFSFSLCRSVLSFSSSFQFPLPAVRGFGHPARLEPATPGLGNRCSILLSYGRMGTHFTVCDPRFRKPMRLGSRSGASLTTRWRLAKSLQPLEDVTARSSSATTPTVRSRRRTVRDIQHGADVLTRAACSRPFRPHELDQHRHAVHVAAQLSDEIHVGRAPCRRSPAGRPRSAPSAPCRSRRCASRGCRCRTRARS